MSLLKSPMEQILSIRSRTKKPWRTVSRPEGLGDKCRENDCGSRFLTPIREPVFERKCADSICRETRTVHGQLKGFGLQILPSGFHVTGRPVTFLVALATILVWGARGTCLWLQRHLATRDEHGDDHHYFSDGVRDPETCQNRDTAAMHIKIDELIRVDPQKANV